MSDFWLQTFTGRKFYPLKPEPEDVCIDDIAHALGMLCRFGGHTNRFYSVAEHCYLLSYAVAPENALHALLHDATEAYIQDLVRPLKYQLPEYRQIENGVWGAITLHLEIPLVIANEVRDFDTRMLLNERDAFFVNGGHRWEVDSLERLTFPLGMGPIGLSPTSATDKFYRRFQELYLG